MDEDAGGWLRDLLRDSGAWLSGHFRLSSGLHSDCYFQCALLFEDPSIAERVCAAQKRQWQGVEIELVAGPALGGILPSYELARQLGVRAIFLERAGGRMSLRRGFRIRPRSRVLVAEDVVTSGGSVREVIDCVEAEGGVVAGVASILFRGRENPFGGRDYRYLLAVPATHHPPETCPLCERGEPIETPGSRFGRAP